MAQGEVSRTIVVDGPVHGAEAIALRGAILTAFETSSEIALDLGALAHADISLIQLIVSAQALAERDGKQFRISHHGYATRNLLERAGFESLLETPTFESSVEVGFFLFDEGDDS